MEHHSNANKIIIDPTNNQILYAIIDSLLIRSMDAGDNWQTIFKIKQYLPGSAYNGIKNIRDIEMKPNDPTVLYLGTDDCASWGCEHRSTIWKLSNVRAQDTSNINKIEISSSLSQTIRTDRWELAVSPANPEIIYAQSAVYDTSLEYFYYYLWKYRDTTWTKHLAYGSTASSVMGVGYYKNTLIISPTDSNIIYVGGNSFYKFKDTINTLTTDLPTSAFLPNFHIDVRCAVLIRSAPGDTGRADKIYVGNDGGLSKSSDGSKTWISLNGRGLSITQFWGLGLNSASPATIGAGSQDNCLFLHNSTLSPPWSNPDIISGDVGNVEFNFYQPTNLLYSCWGSGTSIIQKDSIGQIVPPATIFNPDTTYDTWVTNIPFMWNPLNKHTLYFGYHNIYMKYNQGSSADSIPTPITGRRPISAFDISASDTSRIYVAYDCIWFSSLLRSYYRNGSYLWEDLTDSIRKFSGNYMITSIEVSPKNKDSVWVSFGGFLDDSDPYHTRVLFSHDGGLTWDSDYSTGLPNMPVNCLKFTEKGRRLFAATDAGFFYRDLTMNRWQSFKSGLPVCVVSDLEIDDSTNIIYASTFGRGLWATDLNCIYKSDSLVISSNETWTTDFNIEKSIYIDSSFTLTIKCRVEFPPDAKIHVKQGGTLIVDHGTLTSHCNNMWQGIEVWGRSDLPQNLPYQGMVWIKDSSVIENARIGITTNNKTEDGIYCNSSSGGIIAVQNSTFRNNYKALEFLNYQYPQVSRVIQTTFETDGNFIDRRSHPSDFVSLDAVYGIKFLGCEFINRNTSDNSIPDALKGNGIYSRDGSFLVSKYDFCPSKETPCPDPKSAPSTFQGLYYGIKALNSNPDCSVDIQKTHFNNNYRGIYLSGMNYPHIVQDTFNIPGNGGSVSTDTCYGLYLDRCSFYTVQEDSLISNFPTSLGSNVNSIGIIVNNSGKDVNEIYNNNFSKVKYGIIAQNLNRNTSDTTGLCIKCNDFWSTKYDVIINQQGNNLDYGIARNQGWRRFRNDPAGNKFSPGHNSSNPLADIDNQDAIINYFHHLNTNDSAKRVIPYFSDTNYVKLKNSNWTYEKNLACPSKLSGGGNSSEEDLKTQLAAQQQSIDSVSSALTTLTDGGSTTSLNNDLANSSSSQSYEMYQQLMAYSPYLSDTVIKTAINKENVLPNEMIRDILVANPQAPKSEAVLDQLNNRCIPMPDSMLAEIQNGLDILGARDSIGAVLNNLLMGKHETFSKLVNLYKRDTVNPGSSKDSLIALYNADNTIASKYQLAFAYLDKKDTVGVHNTLNAIPGLFSLTPHESNIHQAYLDFFGIMNSLVVQGKPITDLSPSQIAGIQFLAETTSDPVQTLCRNILITNQLCIYNEPILLPDGTKSSKLKRFVKTGSIAPQSFFKLFPNPAKEFIIVEYNLQDRFKTGMEWNIILTNIQGQKILSRIVSKQQDQVLIGTSLLPKGTYFCTLYLSGKALETQRFIIR